jgi:hypothetical protein
MCKRRVKESFFVFTFVVVFGMTPLSFADQTSIGENPNKPLTQEIKDETVDVSQTIKNYTIKQRDEAVKNAKAALIVLDARIDRMENQLYKKGSSGKCRDRLMDEVESQFKIRLIPEPVGLSFEDFDFVVQSFDRPC